jgi:serine/threonine-protein kinase SRPK3
MAGLGCKVRVHPKILSYKSLIWYRDQKEVALKIAEAKATGEELENHLHMLKSELDHEGRANVLQMLNHFEHHGPNGFHQCMTFDVMDGTLDDSQNYPPFVVQEITRQMALGLDFVHKCGLVHSGS